MMTTTLKLDLQVRDYNLWRQAFAEDQAGRAAHGMRRYRIFRPVDDDKRVLLDGDFDDAASAQRFLDVMRTKVWPDPEKAPAKVGQPKIIIAQLVETHEYSSSIAASKSSVQRDETHRQEDGPREA